MSECSKCPSIYPNLDRFQRMKQSRMRALLEEIQKTGMIPINEFLSYIAVKYGIRRATGYEYLDDWADGGYITVQNGIIKFVKKPEWWK
jgi:hypothetical protein